MHVTVVFGGRSGEHTISCATAAGVLSTINRDRYEVLPIGITPEGRWLLVKGDPAVLELSSNRPPVTITTEGLGRGRLAVPPGDGELTVLDLMGSEILGRIDVVLPLLHGPYGENGTIQSILEMMDIPYAGCGVLVSAAGIDKQVTKVLLGVADIVTTPHVVIDLHAWRRDPKAVLEACRSLTYPLFVKPARAGSSLGINKVDRPEGLTGVIEAAHAVDPKVLVRNGTVGREVEVAVLQSCDDDTSRVAEPDGIAMDTLQGAGEFYDYKTKYLAHDAVTMMYPTRIGPEARDLPIDTAARAFEALGCEELARVGFFLTDAGEVVVSEINMMPGFTPFSMYPCTWQVSGLGYTELVSGLTELAAACSADANR